VFIDEALNLAFSDNDLSRPEVDWLRKTAEMNGISNHRFSEILTNFTILKQKEIASKVSASA